MTVETEHSELRAVLPIDVAALEISPPENVEPICELVDPRTLFVDPAYQRSISEASKRMIARIVANWDWNRFKPPACAYAEHDGKTVLKVFDGQHTATAALSHPGIGKIPVMIHEAPDTEKQASAFVGQNTGHLAVTPLQLYQARLASGDVDAITVSQVCERAGVNILPAPPFPPRQYAVGDTLAVGVIFWLVDQSGAMKARMALEALVKAGFAPVLAPQIKAAHFLLTDPGHRDQITTEALTTAIAGNWTSDHDEAKKIQIAHKWPFWRALAIRWFQTASKPRKSRRLGE